MIFTYTGKKIDPFALMDSDICIEDIAHGLACINRFGGMSPVPHSVAQHSVYVKRLLDNTPYSLQGLLHDASEAYLGDVTRGLKKTHIFEQYRTLEDDVQQFIFKRFHVNSTEGDVIVEKADYLMLRYEIQRSFSHVTLPESYPPLPALEESLIVGWNPWPWYEAKRVFLKEFTNLYFF